jgi:hypothetical protein
MKIVKSFNVKFVASEKLWKVYSKRSLVGIFNNVCDAYFFLYGKQKQYG